MEMVQHFPATPEVECHWIGRANGSDRPYGRQSASVYKSSSGGGTWMVGSLGVAFELIGVEVDFAKIAGGVAGGFVVEVGRVGMAAFAAGGDGAGVDAGAELDDGNEAVAAGAIPLLRVGVGTG